MLVEQYEIKQRDLTACQNLIPESADIFGYPDSLIRARCTIAYTEGLKRVQVQGKTVADIGSGYGHGVLQIGLGGAEFIISGDRWERFMRNQRSIFGGKLPSGFVTLLAEHLPLSDSSCDAIFLNHVLEHIPENQTIPVLSELKRVLKSLGNLVIATPNGENLVAKNPLDEKTYSYGDLRDILKSVFGEVLICSLVPSEHARAVHTRKRLLARIPGARFIRDHLSQNLQEIVLGSSKRRVATNDFYYVDGFDPRAIDFLAFVGS